MLSLLTIIALADARAMISDFVLRLLRCVATYWYLVRRAGACVRDGLRCWPGCFAAT